MNVVPYMPCGPPCIETINGYLREALNDDRLEHPALNALSVHAEYQISSARTKGQPATTSLVGIPQAFTRNARLIVQKGKHTGLGGQSLRSWR